MGVDTKSIFGASIVGVFVFALIGCGSSGSKSKQAPEKEYPQSKPAQEVLVPKRQPSAGPLDTVGYLLGVKHSALGSDFLLQSNIVEQDQVMQFQGLKSRVVYFKKMGDQMAMIESSQGHNLSRNLPQDLILTTFPIIGEDDSAVFFDFNAGMSSIFSSEDWTGQDIAGKEYRSDFSVTPTRVSAIDSMKFTTANQLEIRQLAQIGKVGLMGMTIVPVAVHYYLTPYALNKNFTSTAGADFKQMGFFEVAPQLTTTGSSVIYSTKFDLSRPIVFAISANTPVDYRRAIRDGILYWNKAFGSEVLQVVDAPSDVVAPDPNYNVIQWVDWDQAGMAYADAQIDPRTGETLHAQVWFTSAFAVGSKNKIRALLNRANAQPEKPKAPNSFGLRGFDSASRCDITLSANDLAQQFVGLLRLNYEDEALLRASQDYIRNVVAHEVGHTLGLRHNFAGNLAANYKLSDRQALFDRYIEKDEASVDLITSSSVMEYQPLFEATLTGAKIRRGDDALPYDRAAIQWLYYGRKTPENKMPLFCTDTQISTYADCRQFDASSQAMEWNSYALDQQMQTLPFQLVEKFVDKKNSSAEGSTLAGTEFDIPAWVKSAFSTRSTLMSYFDVAPRLLKVERRFAVVDDTNRTEVRANTLNALSGNIHQAGGLTKLFPEINAQTFDQIETRFTQLVDSPVYSNLLDSRNRDTVLKRGQEILAKLEEETLKAEIQTLDSGSTTLLSEDLAYTLIPIFGKRLEEFVFAMSDKCIDIEVTVISAGEPPIPMVVSPREVRKISLPVFKYPVAIRAAAARLLRLKSAAPYWGAAQKAAYSKGFNDLMVSILGMPLLAFTPNNLPRDAFQWVNENRAVAGGLN